MKDNIKHVIRHSKIASFILKPLYRAIRKLKNRPMQKKAFIEIMTEIKSIDEKKKVIWYFGIPTHMNLGDQAQKYCIKKWIAENYGEYHVVEISSDGFNYKPMNFLELLNEKIQSEDLIVMQSGYTFDGLHPDETAHKLISVGFPNNRIVFFPQTILYKSKKLETQLRQAINCGKRTLLLARDRISYESARIYYPDIKVMMFPDIVTSLIGNMHYHERRTGIMLCMRNDGEKLYSSREISHLSKILSSFGKVDITDTNIMSEIALKDDTILWGEIKKTIMNYSQYQVIVTDRYHGTIFSLAAGTPVIVVKTTDHKVFTGAEWFQDIYSNYIYKAEELSDVVYIAKDIMKKNMNNMIPSYFKEHYYDNLKEIIDSL